MFLHFFLYYKYILRQIIKIHREKEIEEKKKTKAKKSF